LNRTILLVDPNLEVASKIANFLKDFSHIVEMVTTRHEALGAVKAFNPGLIVTAFTLPDGDAFTLLSDLRQISNSQAPVLIMASDKQVEHYAERPMAIKAQGWLKRPVDQMDLYNLVTEWHCIPIDLVEDAKKAMPPKPKPAQAKKEKIVYEEEDAGAPTPKTSTIGSLARVPVARLFYHLGRRELTGLMTLRHPPSSIDVHFEKGKVVNVTSNYIPELSLGMMLARNMMITPQELAGARKKWERDNKMFGRILMMMDLIDEAELNKMLIAQRVKKLVHLFSWNWRSGTYVFSRDPSQVQPAKGFVLPYEHVVVAGIRTHYDIDRLMMVFGKQNRLEQPAKIKTLSPERLASKSDVEGLKKTVDSIRHAPTLEKAMKDSGLDDLTFMQFTYALFVMDILVFAGK